MIIKENGLSADDVYDRATCMEAYVIVHRPHIKVGKYEVEEEEGSQLRSYIVTQ